MNHFISLIILQLFIINNSSCWRLGGEKHWLPDLEFSTRANWVNNKVPSENSRIRFPLEIQHSVGLPLTGDGIFSGIELSHDGSLLLPLTGRIQLTDRDEDKKDETRISDWKWSGPFLWMDPENWSTPKESQKAVPHLERIPCGTDMVILPNRNRSLSIRLPSADVNVKEIRVDNESVLEEWDWEDAMKGREFARSRWSVKYSGLQYCDSDDCLCRHVGDVDELLEEICRIEYPRCSRDGIVCEYPLKVEGHCCSYCGGRITLQRTVSLATINEITVEALKKHDYSVSHHVRVTLDENIEVLVTENDIYTGMAAEEAIDTLERVFSEKGFIVMKAATTGAGLSGSVLGSSLGPVLGIPLMLIFVILIGIPYFGYSYKEIFSIFQECSSIREGAKPGDPRTGNFGFARFENVPEGDVQLASPVGPDDTDSDDNGGKRFENPLYRSRRDAQPERIIDIDKPVSLVDLQRRVSGAGDRNADSD